MIDETLDDEGNVYYWSPFFLSPIKNLLMLLCMRDKLKSTLNTRDLQERQENLKTRIVKGLTARERYDMKEKKKKKQRKFKNKNKALNYFQCHKKGHFKRDFLERKNKQREQMGQSGDVAIVEAKAYKSVSVLVASKVN